MKNNFEISSLIYEYFLTRFQFRYYHRGDTLPTVESLCREFSVAPWTVLTALRRLRAQGYISLRNGCATKVLFEQNEADFRKFSIRFFSQRWEASADLLACCELIIVPLLAEGMCRMEEKDFEYLAQMTEQARVEDLMLFYCYTLQKLENPLAMNLFWETSAFLGFPFTRESGSPLYNTASIREKLSSIICCGRLRDRKAVSSAFLALQRSAVQRMTAAIKPHIQPVAQDEKASFAWLVYRERPQYCYSLAIRILHEIHWSDFRGLEYLPSYEKMAKRYGVSVITIRRTIALLNDFGAVRSVNGKGTRIFPIGQRMEGPDFSSKGVRRNLAFFIQAFEIVLYSCEGVVRTFLSSQTSEGRSALVDGLEEDLRGGRCELSFWRLMIEIASRVPSPAIREIYGKLYGLFLWGYPLKTSNMPDFDQSANQFAHDMACCLQDGDAERFILTVKSQMERMFPIAMQHLLRQGLQPEDLRLSASLKLFIP